MLKPVDVDQQSHMITHLTGILAPVHTRNTMEMGTVLPRFSKLKPIPAPVHTHDTLSWVYPYPCHALGYGFSHYFKTTIKVTKNFFYFILQLCTKDLARGSMNGLGDFPPKV